MRTLRRILVVTTASCSLAGAALAGVITDGSLGAARTLTGPAYGITSDFGRMAGSNLFHSFSQFNISAGESATFSGPAPITNIISRVTGGQASSIDGLLRSTISGANLYLVNPKGIMFGPNASLDISGSFYATSADYLKLGPGGRFDATTPANSVLTVDEPSAFGFVGSTPGSINIDGSRLYVPKGKTLSIIGGDIAITNSADTSVLRAPGGRINLASVASSGELAFTPGGIDSSMFSAMGAISLANTGTHDKNKSPGDISATIANAEVGSGSIYISGGKFITDNGWIFSWTPGQVDGRGIFIQARDSAEIKNGSWICTDTYSSGNAGVITLLTSALEINGNSQISTCTDGSGKAGNISITAHDIKVDGDSWIRADTNLEASGNAGNILINTSDCSLDGESWISSNSSSIGNGGVITVNASGAVEILNKSAIIAQAMGIGNPGNIVVGAKNVILKDGGYISNSGGSTQTASISIVADESVSLTGSTSMIDGSSVMNNASNVSINTGNLTVSDGAQINATTMSSGMAGNIVINATNSVNVIGEGAITNGAFDAGGAGSISITAKDLFVQDGGWIGANSNPLRGTGGNAGTIDIQASGLVSVSGDTSFIGCPAFSAILELIGQSSSAGIITIDAAKLTVNKGGIIDTSNSGTGISGKIAIHATDSVSVSENGAISSNAVGQGAGGDISIIADRSVSVSSSGDIGGITTASYGTGNGGKIDLKTPFLSMTDGGVISAKSLSTGIAGSVDIRLANRLSMNSGSITTEAANAGGGNITIVDSALIDMRNSRVTTSVNGGVGNGGDITMSASSLVLDHSKVTANAVGGNGGNINIATNAFLADPQSRVTASSQLGLAGTIGISAPLVDLSGNIAALPEGMLNTRSLAPRQCAGNNESENSFVIETAGYRTRPVRNLVAY